MLTDIDRYYCSIGKEDRLILGKRDDGLRRISPTLSSSSSSSSTPVSSSPLVTQASPRAPLQQKASSPSFLTAMSDTNFSQSSSLPQMPRREVDYSNIRAGTAGEVSGAGSTTPSKPPHYASITPRPGRTDNPDKQNLESEIIKSEREQKFELDFQTLCTDVKAMREELHAVQATRLSAPLVLK